MVLVPTEPPVQIQFLAPLHQLAVVTVHGAVTQMLRGQAGPAAVMAAVREAFTLVVLLRHPDKVIKAAMAVAPLMVVGVAAALVLRVVMRVAILTARGVTDRRRQFQDRLRPMQAAVVLAITGNLAEDLRPAAQAVVGLEQTARLLRWLAVLIWVAAAVLAEHRPIAEQMVARAL